MNDEQIFRIASIKELSVDLLTAAHDQDEDRLLMVMAELTELFRVVRMDHDTRRRDDVHLEPDPPATRSGDALKALVEAEFMRQVGLSDDVRYEHEAFALENPPVVTEPIDVAPRVFEIADDDDAEPEPSYDMSYVEPWFEYEAEAEDTQDDDEPELKMSAMYDATTKWV